MSKLILIKGAGEMASAVAYRLFKCGFRVVMTDIQKPTAVRRMVSFCSAIYEGDAAIEGVFGEYRISNKECRMSKDKVLVFVDEGDEVKVDLKPDVIVDARVMKKNLDMNINDAPLTIALGPGFEAGVDVHYVVETNRGHDLGRIISKGFAADDTKIPGSIGGFTKERVLRSPGEGEFVCDYKIGDLVAAGDVIGTVGGFEMKTEITGVIRGLVMPGLIVKKNQKMGDVDPRGDVRNCSTISDKARNISGSVLEIVLGHRA